MIGGVLASCKDDEHCLSDAYCDPVELVCRPCIQCVDLKRLPLPASAPAACISQCGSCFTGLVENRKTMECVEPEAAGAWDEWLVTLVALHLLALLLCVCAALVLRNFRAYKLRASTHAHALCETRVESGSAPIPLPPPPYSSASSDVPSHHVENEETSAPLIKEAPSLQPETTAAGAGIPASSGNQKATAQIQGARVFNEPVYQSLITGNEEVRSDENDMSLEMLQRAPDILDAHRASSDTTLSGGLDKRPARHRVRMDSNNDSEDSGFGDQHGGAGGAWGAGSAGGATFMANNSIPFFINIYKNFNAAPQDDESIF